MYTDNNSFANIIIFYLRERTYGVVFINLIPKTRRRHRVQMYLHTRGTILKLSLDQRLFFRCDFTAFHCYKTWSITLLRISHYLRPILSVFVVQFIEIRPPYTSTTWNNGFDLCWRHVVYIALWLKMVTNIWPIPMTHRR